MREHGTADTPLMPWSQGNGLPRARIVASSAMGVAVLLLIGMETRGLMRVVDEEAAGLVREPAWPLRGLRAGPVSLLGRCLSGDCVDGEGTYLWRSGEMYEGPFKRGRMMGKGTYTWKDVPNNTTYEYVGEFDHGEMPKGCVAGDCGGFLRHRVACMSGRRVRNMSGNGGLASWTGMGRTAGQTAKRTKGNGGTGSVMAKALPRMRQEGTRHPFTMAIGSMTSPWRSIPCQCMPDTDQRGGLRAEGGDAG